MMAQDLFPCFIITKDQQAERGSRWLLITSPSRLSPDRAGLSLLAVGYLPVSELQ